MGSKYQTNEQRVKDNLHIQALVNGKLAPKCDPIEHSFTWAKGDRGEEVSKELICSLRGWSKFGYHGFFKPSLAELISCIPDDLIKQVDYVQIADEDAVGTNLTDGVHEFEFLLYRKLENLNEIEGVPV